jgi:hypothetical protein
MQYKNDLFEYTCLIFTAQQIAALPPMQNVPIYLPEALLGRVKTNIGREKKCTWIYSPE